MNPDDINDIATLLAYQQYIHAQAARAPARIDIGQIANMQHLRIRSDEITGETDFIHHAPVPLRLLLEAGGVIYGSRGLHIENQYSDYDFAFSIEQHKELYTRLINARVSSYNPTSYFQSSPEAGYHTFFKYEGLDPVTSGSTKVDILFVHTDEDLDVIRSSIQDLQSIPKYMLRNKKFRVDAYNTALQHRGWKEFRMEQITGARMYRNMFNTTSPSPATVVDRPEGNVVRVTSQGGSPWA